MNKGFFISLDLIISISAIVLLIGLLGIYVHNSIMSYAEYKENKTLNANLNIVMNRISNSEYSCDLVDSSNNDLNKKVFFCLQRTTNIYRLFSDLDFNVALVCNDVETCLGYNVPSITKNYIAKDVFVLIPNSKTISKKEYYNCIQGNCDINKMVRIYVW